MPKNMGLITLMAWLVTFVAVYVGLGGYLWELLEGVDPSMLPLTPIIVLAVLLVATSSLTVIWAKNLEHKNTLVDRPSGRRKFLFGSAALTGGIVGAGAVTYAKMSPWRPVATDVFLSEVEKTSATNDPRWSGAQIVHKRQLGRTGFMVSDISIGTTQFLRHADPEGLLREVLDRGVNYIDTSPDYGGSKSETAVGNVIAERKRDELFVVTKWCTAGGHVRQGSSTESYLEALEDSLSRLQTDYVDLVHVHSCDTVERLLDPNMLAAFEIAKEQGKARFLGVSTHTPNLEEVAYAAIDSNKFDVLMLAYHHGAWPKQKDIIKKAAQKNIGIVAMKTLKGAKHRGMIDFQKEDISYTQAAFKWVMNDPGVACLVVSYFETQHVDEYIYASGKKLTENDVAVLRKYDDMIAGTHCFASCGDCLSSCPSSVAINDVLRHRMYFEDYGDQKQAMQLYAALETNADACITCDAPCSGACPEGINIRERMIGAHEKLTLA